MPGVRAARKPQMVNVQYVGGKRDGQVARIPDKQARMLSEKGGQCIFLSNSLFKAAKAGINIRRNFQTQTERRDDANIKLQTQLHRERMEEGKRKRRRERRKENVK